MSMWWIIIGIAIVLIIISCNLGKCFHKWSAWSDEYNSTDRRSRGSFGDTSLDNVVCQQRSCSKCRIIEVVIVRNGKVEDRS